MASQRLFAAFAALSILIGSEASPCKPISSTTEIQATSTFSSETETATASDATFTSELTSTESSYVTDITITESETATSSEVESTSTVVVSTTETSAFTSTTEAASTTEAVSTTSAAPIEAPTIIINGDFETGSIAPWVNFGIGAFANIDVSPVHSGSYSLEIGSQASEWSYVFQVLRKSTLVANQPYSLTLYAKVSSGTSCSAFEAFIDNNDLSDAFGQRISVTGAQIANDFTGLSGEFSLTQTALDSNNAIRVIIRAKCSNGFVAWVDDVHMGISD